MTKKKPTNDEVVNGPAVAAKILSHMTTASKDRILKEIERREPELAQKIEDNMSTFEDIAELTPQGVQRLIQEVPHEDLVLALKLCDEDTRKVIEENMSQRKREQVKDDLDSLPPMRKTQVEEAQRRIMQILEDLREKGAVRSRAKKDLYI